MSVLERKRIKSKKNKIWEWDSSDNDPIVTPGHILYMILVIYTRESKNG